MDISDIRGFFMPYTWRVDRLLIPIKVYNPELKWERKIWGLLDTGATNSVISDRIAEDMWFVPIGKIPTITPHGPKECYQYIAYFDLPDDYRTKLLKVTSWPLDKQWFDVLIGMDVLSEWDFTMSVKDGNTVISFITPNQEPINLVDKYIMRQLSADRANRDKIQREQMIAKAKRNKKK